MVKEINMSEREVSRADVFSDVSRKKISQIRAAEILGISPRHLIVSAHKVEVKSKAILPPLYEHLLARSSSILFIINSSIFNLLVSPCGGHFPYQKGTFLFLR